MDVLAHELFTGRVFSAEASYAGKRMRVHMGYTPSGHIRTTLKPVDRSGNWRFFRKVGQRVDERAAEKRSKWVAG